MKQSGIATIGFMVVLFMFGTFIAQDQYERGKCEATPTCEK